VQVAAKLAERRDPEHERARAAWESMTRARHMPAIACDTFLGVSLPPISTELTPMFVSVIANGLQARNRALGSTETSLRSVEWTP
jgi:hypothetical protein